MAAPISSEPSLAPPGRSSGIDAALRIPELFYRFGIAVRNNLYDYGVLPAETVDCPVICVGNATVGGSGKTPLTSYVASELYSRGGRPGVLLRGYGGSARGPLEVMSAGPLEVTGDEALLHRRWLPAEIPVAVSRNRVLGARMLLEKGCSCVVLDDGYQHRRLARTLNILVLDVSDETTVAEWSSGRLLPRGRLREPLESALARAQLVALLSRTQDGLERFLDTGSQTSFPAKWCGFRLAPRDVLDECAGASYPLDWLKGRPVLLWSSIAKPWLFSDLVKQLGANVVAEVRERDHFVPTEKAVREMLARAKASGAVIAVTEKDAVKIGHYASRLEELVSVRLGVNASLNAQVFEESLTGLQNRAPCP